MNIGNAFDISSELVATSREVFGNAGAYKASVELRVTNHKDIAAEIEVLLNSYSGDSLVFTWDPTNAASFVKESATVYKCKLTIKPNEKVVLKWIENLNF